MTGVVMYTPSSGARIAAIGCIAFGIVPAILASPAVFLGMMFAANAEKTVLQREVSPDGWKEARVQHVDAGAISGYDRQVYVKSSWNPSEWAWLNCRAFWGEGTADVELQWLDDTTLQIDHHFSPKNVRESTSSCGSVRIVARAVEPFEDF